MCGLCVMIINLSISMDKIKIREGGEKLKKKKKKKWVMTNESMSEQSLRVSARLV